MQKKHNSSPIVSSAIETAIYLFEMGLLSQEGLNKLLELSDTSYLPPKDKDSL